MACKFGLTVLCLVIVLYLTEAKNLHHQYLDEDPDQQPLRSYTRTTAWEKVQSTAESVKEFAKKVASKAKKLWETVKNKVLSITKNDPCSLCTTGPVNPVCDSNGKTHPNMHCLKCQELTTREEIKVVYEGICYPAGAEPKEIIPENEDRGARRREQEYMFLM